MPETCWLCDYDGTDLNGHIRQVTELLREDDDGTFVTSMLAQLADYRMHLGLREAVLSDGR